MTGPVCTGCGTPITRQPGRRTRLYCSDACRKRVKRLLAAQAPTTEPNPDRRLGRTCEKVDPPSGPAPAPTRGNTPAEPGVRIGSDPRRDARMTLLEGLQKVTKMRRLKGCRKWLAEGSGGATVMAGPGGGSFAGLQTCGSVHICPVCGHKIRSHRAEEADRYVTAWQEAGHGIALWTLTMRHYKRMALGSLRKSDRHGLVAIQHDAFNRAFGARFVPRTWKKYLKRLGVVGTWRVWECTAGDNGWHPHFHVLIFTEKQWGPDTAADFEGKAAQRWSKALVDAGGYRPSDRGCQVDVRAAEDPSGAAGKYLFKEQDGKPGFASLAHELADTGSKLARRGGRMPMEIAEGAVAGDADDLDLWWEYERATHGLRLHYLTPGIRARLAELVDVDDRSDQEVAEEEGERTPVAVFPAETWRTHVAGVQGRRLALLHAAEERYPVDVVERLVTSWGLQWGTDVLPADQVTPSAAKSLGKEPPLKAPALAR